LLRFCDPQWLVKLRLGASLKLWAIATGIILGFVVGFLVSFLSLPIVLVQLVTLASSAIGIWGTWCVTAQEPRIALNEETLTLRKFIRGSAIASAIGSILLIAGNAAPLSSVVLLIGAILCNAGYAATYGELFYFRRFGNRIPDPDLVRSTTRMIILAPIYGVILVAGIVATRLFAKTIATGPGTSAAGAAAPAPVALAPSWGVTVGVGVCGGLVLGLIFFLWYVRLLTKYKKRFTEAIAQASASTPPPVPAAPTPPNRMEADGSLPP